MRVTFTSAFRRTAPALALLLLAGLTALPANAQYGPAYPPPGPNYYGNNGFLNNASYYVYQNNPYRPSNMNQNTDFSYHVIPPTINPDAPTNGSDDSTEGRMYLYNFTGTAGPVYDNPSEIVNQYCFPC